MDTRLILLAREDALVNDVCNLSDLTRVQRFVKCSLGKLLCSITTSKSTRNFADIGSEIMADNASYQHA